MFALAFAVAARLLGRSAGMPAYLIFLAFQIAAFVFGFLSLQAAVGKTAFIASAVMAVASAPFLA